MNNGHWAAHRERGSYLLMTFTVVSSRLLGRRLLSPLLYAIVLYFFVAGRSARQSVREYQQRLADWSGRRELQPSLRSVFGQFMAFADALLDKIDVWHGRIGFADVDIEDPAGIRPQSHAREGRGQMLVGAHLGNLEVCRAMAEKGGKAVLNVLVHTKHAEQFNRLLGEAGASNLRLVQVSELDAGTMLQLSQRLDAGEWLAIAGDRIALHGGRNVTVDFLGAPAALPQGTWLLAGLLECKVNLFFCLKRGGRYRVIMEPFAERIVWNRREREAVIRAHAQRYAERLAHHCLQAPLQWFNFFAFWKTHDDSTS